ncbi:hypothetical protein [Micromonospora sp. NPDC005171]|uniref:hypothetical protein n=1 Tax=Micromonospora sp. NPDC005171 TaxID=3156866 RepID=UPI0033BB65D2
MKLNNRLWRWGAIGLVIAGPLPARALLGAAALPAPGRVLRHFTTSRGCLDRILDGWAAVPAQPPTMAPTDQGFPLPAATIPDTIGWRFDAPSYEVHRREGDVVTGNVVAVRDGKRLSVYLLARFA